MKNYDEVVDWCKQVVSDNGYDNDSKCVAYMYLSEALSKKGALDSHKGMNSYMRDAIEACDLALELCEEEDPYRYTIFKQKGDIEQILLMMCVLLFNLRFIAAMDSRILTLKRIKNSSWLLTREISSDKSSFLNNRLQ